jgi:two-component system CheB/CheR fusion protein
MAEAIGAMSGMLNALLDINQIDAGTVHAEQTSFRIGDLLDRLRDEFTYHAEARGLVLRVVPCDLSTRSDPALLEQIIRNLLSNAIKYTRQGKVLMGCRRRGGMLSIEVWDTGIGIPEADLQSIFEEYHQLDNSARDPSRGLGLGLSIVQRLANLLGHRLSVRSRPGKGSAFSIEVRLASSETARRREALPPSADGGTEAVIRRAGAILVVEDDPEVRELLEIFLNREGYRAAAAPDGMAALELVARGAVRPDIVLTDYNLPNGMSGLQFIAELRERFRRDIPAIVLTGDISTGTLRDIERQNCVHLGKPVKMKELTQVIQRLLTISPSAERPDATRPANTSGGAGLPVIYVVDDDRNVRESIRSLLVEEGRPVEDYSTAEEFLGAWRAGQDACLLVDANLPGMSGLDLLKRLSDEGHSVPTVMITGHGDVAMAVQAMKAGALDFIEKPIGPGELLASVQRALALSRDASKLSEAREDAAKRIANLTPRQREILDLVLSGHPSKNIAADLGISQRTVENHRAAIMQKMGAKSLPALARLALAAA